MADLLVRMTKDELRILLFHTLSGCRLAEVALLPQYPQAQKWIDTDRATVKRLADEHSVDIDAEASDA